MSSSDARSPNDERFRTTRWSLVHAAQDSQSRDSQEALSELCQSYWFPVYAYMRRRVPDVNEAQDLTQEFFAKLLEKNYLADVREERGRFRAYLLTAAQRFLSKQWAKANALKRGGGKTVLSLDFTSGESQYTLEPADEETPERIFDRQWAVKLLERVHQRLRSEYEASGKSELYQTLRPFLAGAREQSGYNVAASRLNMTPGAIKTAVYRMRNRYRELLRREISDTVADPRDVDDEIKQLFAALG